MESNARERQTGLFYDLLIIKNLSYHCELFCLLHLGIFVRHLQVWRQKAQYLQHKQNKAEATTVKHKSVTETKSKGLRPSLSRQIFHLQPLFWDLFDFLSCISTCNCHSFSNRNGSGVPEQSAHCGDTLPRQSS